MHNYATRDFPKVYRTFSPLTDRAYVACYLRWTGTSTTSTVWKLARFGTGEVYSGTNKFAAEYTASANATGPQSLSATTLVDGQIAEYAGTSDVPSHLTLMTPDTWHFYEAEISGGTLNGNDLFAEQRIDGVPNIRFTGSTFFSTANPQWINHVLTPVNGLDSSGTRAITFFMDEVYTDGSRARVVMTDAVDYAASTTWALQPVVEWSDGAVKCAYNRGSLPVGTTAYRHVFNHDGVRVHTTPGFTVP